MVSSKQPRILAVVPARGGSKGLPGKNIRSLAGIPLIAHTLAAANRCPSITRTVVSTDNADIARVAQEYGADVPFMRPAELAEDSTPMAPVLRHALETIENLESNSYDFLILMDPTSPVRDPKLIESAIQEIQSASEDGIIAISEPEFHPSFVGVRFSKNQPMQRYYEEGISTTRRQQVPPFYRINGNFYIWRAAFIRRLNESWFDEGTHRGFVIPEKFAFAIDHQYEFDLIQALSDIGFISLPGASKDLASMR